MEATKQSILQERASMKHIKTQVVLIITAVALLGGTSLIMVQQVSAYGWGNDQLPPSAQHRSSSSSHQQVNRHDHERFFQQYLNRALQAGRITPQQKQLILAKHAELQMMHDDLRDEWRDLSPEEKRAMMQARHDELVEWADANGIDPAFFNQLHRRYPQPMG